MTRTRIVAVAVLAALGLQGCSTVGDALWPSEDGSGQGKAGASSAPPAPPPPAPPQLATSEFTPPPIAPGQPTGTFVGQKVAQIRNELRQLQQSLANQDKRLQQIRAQTLNNSRQYHAAVGAINARLQVGTTPGNPTLINEWNTAQALLSAIENDMAEMNSLANDVSNTSTMSAYLLETSRAAYGLTGAVDEDHRQLDVIEDEVNRTVVLIDRLLRDISTDVNRQTKYVAAERANLTTLSVAIKNGELFGSSLANRSFTPGSADAGPSLASASGPPPVARAPSPASVRAAMPSGPRRPLVVIRFDRPNVEYQQALYTAVSRALERRPGASFDLVAVAPSRGTSAQVTVASNNSKRNAESVLRSLSDMGLPLDRVRLSAVTSDDAASNEVHIYVR